MKNTITVIMLSLGLSAGLANAQGTGFGSAAQPPQPPQGQNLQQAISDQAQRTTLAFSALAMLTGNLESQSFFPPGKVADYTGFQYLRDNDPDGMGHNTSFLTRVANNMLYILNDSQMAMLKSVAIGQVSQINQYGYKRFALMKAFRRMVDGALPTGASGLSLSAVKAASKELYLIDGQISFDRAVLYADIYRSMDATQTAYMAAMKGKGWASWPNIADDLVRGKTAGLTQDQVVAVMTYAGDLFSWYAGSIDADVYFCPERHGTYYGAFYMKDAPAVGHEGYSISTTITAEAGAAVSDASLGYVTASQAALFSSLVDTQRNNLYAGSVSIVSARTDIATALRSLISATAPTDAYKAQVLALVLDRSATYGELDGENNYQYATVFATLYKSLTDSQKAKFLALRKSILAGTYTDGTPFDFTTCTTPYLYSGVINDTSVLATYISNTDAFFTTGSTVTTRIISVSGNLTFGNVHRGSYATSTLTIANSGTAAMTVTGISYPTGFSGAWSGSVPAGGTQQVTVMFAPDAMQTYGGTVTVSADHTSGTNTTTATAQIVPFGSFDTPASNATGLSGSFAVTGWAIDDLAIDRVELWRDLVSGETTPAWHSPYGPAANDPREGKVFIAVPVFVPGSRPDVEAAFTGYPGAASAGWGYLLLSQGLWKGGQGTYTLYAYAFDAAGHVTTLGSKTIGIDNSQAAKPFGALDTPAYGATVSGGLWNFGWALTPNATPSCPIANGSVWVGIDSRPLQQVSYGDLRSDIAAAFPGLANSSGAGGAYWLDTTALTDGLHQIGWLVTDGCGRSDGVGSRFFTVKNSSGDASAAAADAPMPSARRRAAVTRTAGTVSVRQEDGYWQMVLPTPDGIHAVQVAQGGRIEVQLPPSAGTYTGATDVNGDRRALPVGSSLDGRTGMFYWQPGPGFLGVFDLVFDANDGRAPIHLRVVVSPGV